MADPFYGADELIAHAAFLRALARHLLSDEHEAEDVIQETWLPEHGTARFEAIVRSN